MAPKLPRLEGDALRAIVTVLRFLAFIRLSPAVGSTSRGRPASA